MRSPLDRDGPTTGLSHTTSFFPQFLFAVVVVVVVVGSALSETPVISLRVVEHRFAERTTLNQTSMPVDVVVAEGDVTGSYC